MHPIICRIGPFEVYSFGVMIALAVIVCSFLMAREGRALGLPAEEVYDLVFWAAVGGVLGARVLYVFLNPVFFLSNPVEIIMLNHGGLAWQGGLVGGALAVFFLVRRKQRPVLFMADFVAPYLALGHAIGRIGCFLNGCCYGREIARGIYFPVHGAHLHPTQLYEMVLLMLLFVFLKKAHWLWIKNQGAVFSIYLILAAVIRFGVEFFRADHEPLLFNLSIFQYISMFIMTVGIAMFYYVTRRHVV